VKCVRSREEDTYGRRVTPGPCTGAPRVEGGPSLPPEKTISNDFYVKAVLKKRFLWQLGSPLPLLRKRFPSPKELQGPYSFSIKTMITVCKNTEKRTIIKNEQQDRSAQIIVPCEQNALLGGFARYYFSRFRIRSTSPGIDQAALQLLIRDLSRS